MASPAAPLLEGPNVRRPRSSTSLLPAARVIEKGRITCQRLPTPRTPRRLMTFSVGVLITAIPESQERTRAGAHQPRQGWWPTNRRNLAHRPPRSRRCPPLAQGLPRGARLGSSTSAPSTAETACGEDETEACRGILESRKGAARATTERLPCRAVEDMLGVTCAGRDSRCRRP